MASGKLCLISRLRSEFHPVDLRDCKVTDIHIEIALQYSISKHQNCAGRSIVNLTKAALTR